MPSAHALLSASGSSRWLHCTPSAKLEARIPDERSPYAYQGTKAHAVAEEKLKAYKAKSRRKIKADDGEMAEATDAYKAYVIETMHKAGAKRKDIYIEVSLNLSEWIPEGFGTADAVIIGKDAIHVIDLKYGKGVQVDAYKNSQLMLYGAGALNKFNPDVKYIELHIFQPRLDYISTYRLTVNQLQDWLTETVAKQAKLAMEGKGEQEPGDWCRFCKVRGQCKARSQMMQRIIEENAELDTMLLTNDDIAELLPKVKAIKMWSDDISQYALDEALKGTKFTGYKLVEGISRRKIVKPGELAKRLEAEGYKEEDIFKPKELQNLTKLEKLVGKKQFAELSQGTVDKPQGKPTLVEESDKRPELNSALKDFEDDFK